MHTPPSPDIPELTRRPYQSQAIRSVIHGTRDYLAGALETSGAKYDTALLLEMATGSGKTFTVGQALELMLKLRNRYAIKNYSELRVLMLSDRIDGVEQFRDDLFHGRPDTHKPPIIAGKVRNHIDIYTFHSRADSIADLDEKYQSNRDDMSEEHFGDGGAESVRDTFYFATFQTADLQSIEGKIPYFDIIVIDEAHNVREGNDFENLVDRLVVHGRDGRSPIILPVTATPTNLTEDLFGSPRFRYGLAEYLASEYSPEVDYTIVTSDAASPEILSSIHTRIEAAKDIESITEKKREIRSIIRDFESILAQFGSADTLATDILTRLPNEDGDIDETIIFAGSISEADDIVRALNQKANSNIAEAYHSGTDRKGLAHLKDKEHPTKIIVAVDMLNESVDLPQVSNVVFWRLTNIARVFLQQFGRGLRGDGLVRFYDYAGSFTNFAWMGAIYEEYRQYRSTHTGSSSSGGGRGDTFHISGLSDAISTSGHRLDLTRLGFELRQLEQSTQMMTLSDYRAYFEDETTQSEWEAAGIILDREEKRVNLDEIKNPKTYNLFGIGANHSIKNLANLMGMKREKAVGNIPEAQEILEKFFEEHMGYRVEYEKREKRQSGEKLDTIDAHITHILDKKNLSEYVEYGIKLGQTEKTVNLDGVKSPKTYNLFGIGAKYSLRNLANLMGMKREKLVSNVSEAQEILEKFFEEHMGYIVEYERKGGLESIKAYVKHALDETNQGEWAAFGIMLDRKNKTVNLDRMQTPVNKKLCGKWGQSSFKDLANLMGMKQQELVTTITGAKKILLKFFEEYMEYRVIKGASGIQKYQEYFEDKKNKGEWEAFGIMLDRKNKTVSLDNIKTLNRKRIFGVPAGSILKNLSHLMGVKSDKKVFNSAIEGYNTLYKFFSEYTSYKVLMNKEIKLRGNKLEDIEAYRKYFEAGDDNKERRREWETFGIIINQQKKIVYLDGIKNLKAHYLFDASAPWSLKKLANIMGMVSKSIVIRKVSEAQEILEKFFKEHMGYRVERRGKKSETV